MTSRRAAKAAKNKKAPAKTSKKKSKSKSTSTSKKKVRMSSPAAQSVRPAPPGSNGNGASAGYAERFDRAPYEVPMMDLSEAIALANELLEAKPARPTPPIAEELAQMEKALTRAKAIPPGADESSIHARPFDVAMDRAWATAVRRIQDHAELPMSRHPDAVAAAKVYAIVQDLSILKLNYVAELAQIGGRLDSLRREGLLDDARKFAGGAFIDEVLHCHAEYGKALGQMNAPAPISEVPPPERKSADRGETRLALIEAVREYAFQVLALARAGRADTWKQVDAALEPIAALRLRQARELRAQAPIVKPDPHPPIAASSNR